MKYTKAQIKSKLDNTIKAMHKAQKAMYELRKVCEETNDEIIEKIAFFETEPYLYCNALLKIAELCGLDIEDTAIELEEILSFIL